MMVAGMAKAWWCGGLLILGMTLGACGSTRSRHSFSRVSGAGSPEEGDLQKASPLAGHRQFTPLTIQDAPAWGDMKIAFASEDTVVLSQEDGESWRLGAAKATAFPVLLTSSMVKKVFAYNDEALWVVTAQHVARNVDDVKGQKDVIPDLAGVQIKVTDAAGQAPRVLGLTTDALLVQTAENIDLVSFAGGTLHKEIWTMPMATAPSLGTIVAGGVSEDGKVGWLWGQDKLALYKRGQSADSAWTFLDFPVVAEDGEHVWHHVAMELWEDKKGDVVVNGQVLALSDEGLYAGDVTPGEASAAP